jgi:hypothetical protein
MDVVETPSEGKPSMSKSIENLQSVTRVGVDLAKNVFQIHAVDAKGDVVAARGASPWRGLLIVDLANGDIVEWMRIEGDVMELFDVAVVPNVRCPRGLGPGVPELSETLRGEI